MWLVLLLGFVSATNLTQYQNSLDAYNVLKSESGNCYTYQVVTSSWVGFGSRTSITVENGTVTQRSYEAWDSNRITTSSYEETDSTSIGSNSDGADPVTLDELYAECPNYLSMDETLNSIYFSTDDNNVMTSCGYVPNFCADDCFTGISLSSIEFCSVSENLIAYQNSLATWNTLKIQYDDCYSYSSRYTSWVGSSATTTINIEDGIVVQRSYQGFDVNGAVTSSYVETESAEIGSNLSGAEAKTMDEIYTDCSDYLVKSQDDNYVYFETDEYGLISLCGHTPKNCADDCFIGDRITTFDFCPIILTTTQVIDGYNMSRYQQSLNDWNSLKVNNDNCYTYSTGYTSWTGYGSTTAITVEDGIVVQRSYKSYQLLDGQQNVIDSYDEIGISQIGTNTAGADAVTMDELYTECPQYLSVDEQNNDMTFTTDDNNILSRCTYYPLGCQDDCSVGISVSSLEFCGDDNEYDNSLDSWNMLKLEHNDCYSYTSSFTSWVGFGSTTTIKVEDGTVIQRSYEATNSNGAAAESYDETGTDIGTNESGESALTIDELYGKCPTYLNKTESTIYFETDDDNIISRCGYVSNNCADDCFEGISIDSLEFCDEEETGINNDSSMISTFFMFMIVLIGITQQMTL